MTAPASRHSAALRRLSPAQRLTRLVFGLAAAALGAFCLVLLELLVVQLLRRGAPEPPRLPGGWLTGAIALPAATGLFAGLTWMGAKRVVAAVRGTVPAHTGTRPPPPSFSAEQSTCAFCGQPRSEVKFLVVGLTAAICDGCAPAALAIFAEQYDARDEVAVWCGQLVRALPHRCPRAISRPFIERLVGAERSAIGLRNAVRWCFEVGNRPLARELLEGIPERERTATDWLNLGVALEDEGRLAEALAATDRAGADETVRPWTLSNGALFRAELGAAAPAAERAGWLRDVEEAQRLIQARRPEGWEQVLPCFIGAEAAIRGRAGDPAGALETLTRVINEGPWTGGQLMTRARALRDLGRAAEARADLERALKLLHPECRDAREARELLGTAGIPPQA